jgi:hypothetical protein
MSKHILLFAFALFFQLTIAQNNCQNALPFCAGGVSGVTFPATTSTPQIPAQPGPNYGCLATVPNPAWYFLQVNNPGSLNILIQGQIGSPPVPGTDVDFICWTDMPVDSKIDAKIIPTEPCEWPTPTLMRFHLFLREEKLLETYDFIFYERIIGYL